MKKLLLLSLLLNTLSISIVNAASVPLKNDKEYPFKDSVFLINNNLTANKIRPADKKLIWRKWLKEIFILKAFKKQATSPSEEISTTKKVLSVLSREKGFKKT